MSDLRDHPDIAAMERTGSLTNEPDPVCPVCGRECGEIYFDKYGAVCGCDNCMEVRDVWECLDKI